jgi:hypothetical protein
MPEIPDGYDAYDPQQPADLRDDYLVRLPRSAVRGLERKAEAYDRLRAEAEHDRPIDTPLEPGEADLGRERRALAADAPPDTPQVPDPVAEARRVHDRVIEDGGLERHAIGAGLNVLANAAARGDRRVIITPEQERWA